VEQETKNGLSSGCDFGVGF